MIELESFRTPVAAPSGGAARRTRHFAIGPDDVVDDPSLTLAEKKAILAAWASDAHAVEGAPALRRLESGAVVTVDAILSALKRLDGSGGDVIRLDRHARRRAGLPKPAHWMRPPWRRRDDDDDEPPPCAAALAIPPRPPLMAVAA